jgi:hypothetical protein
MESPLLLMAAILGLGAVYVVPAVVMEAYSRYSGTRDLACPNTHQTATVRMDARRAALTAAYGRPKVQVVDCSLWPGHKDCDRGCRREV